jgi:F-type H+-transporting ATPase subunit delta
MAELATIARPYADALFKAQSADLAGTAAWLDELAAVASNSQLLQFSENPKVTDAQVFDLISGVVKSTLPAAAQNFLRLTIENHRLVALPEIASQFRALKNAQGGTADAIVHSAFPIDAAALADLSGTLEKRFGRKLNVKVEIDASLIGGVCVVVGDEVLDTSVKARLEQMKEALTAGCSESPDLFKERRKESCNSIQQKFLS